VTTSSAAPAGRFGHALRALRYRDFRLFTIGQSISAIGSWMQQVAVWWLVYRLTDSALLLGLVAFVSQGPVFLLAPIAGDLADRWSRHRIIIVTQALAMAQALLLAVLVLTDTIAVWQIIVLSGVLGAVMGFDIPARQSFLLEMVGSRDDLPNAIALNSSIFNAARLIGPAIAGFAIAAIGEGAVILVNALSYGAVLAALLAMRVAPRPPGAGHGGAWRRMREGFGYAWGFPPIRAILLLVAFTSIVAVPFSVLLPVISTRVLGGDARTLGMLMAATGGGALAGALYLASRRSVLGLGRVITVAAVLFGLALVGIGLSTWLPLSLALLVLAGFGMMTQMAASNTVLQTLVDDDKRGRVMSLFSMAFVGTAPLGSLLAGAIADRYGAPAMLAAGGLACAGAAIAFRLHLPRLRSYVLPVYLRLGIVPEVARGIQAATHQTTPPLERPDR
jgi:MFS family permease